ncbi:MAG: hypothetical protein QXM22_05130 [Candidatus Bathyarchaeia archaeon]
MVEKRTLVFLMLGIVVWAGLASAFAGYYYLQYANQAEQFNETQKALNQLATNYNDAVNKYDLLLSDYSALYGNYSLFTSTNYASLLPLLGNLVKNFAKNYTSLLTQEDLNETYNRLLDNYNTLQGKANVTNQEFKDLLNEYYALFSLSALRNLGSAISETATLTVNIGIDYGNGTLEWHNNTKVYAGYTLFRLTQEIAAIDYSYYALMEPGHILIDSINDKANYIDPVTYSWGYSWIWYYWNENQNDWVVGPVGCDAWLLKDGGVYKWDYEYWQFP